MKKHRITRQLSRDSQARQALFRGLLQALIEHEQLTTTLAKARAIRPLFEKLITKAKSNSLANFRAVQAELQQPVLVKKLMGEIAPRFAAQAGGYTKLTRLSARRGDSAPLARLSLTKLASPSPSSKSKPSSSHLEPSAPSAAPSPSPVSAPLSTTKPVSAPKITTRSSKRGNR